MAQYKLQCNIQSLSLEKVQSVVKIALPGAMLSLFASLLGRGRSSSWLLSPRGSGLCGLSVQPLLWA